MITLDEGKARALAGRAVRRHAGKPGTGEGGGEALALDPGLDPALADDDDLTALEDLVWHAVQAGAITCPPGTELSLQCQPSADGSTYQWLVTPPGTRYALASRYRQKVAGIGHDGRVTGEAAALAVLREAAACGSELLRDHAARTRNTTTPADPGWCGTRAKRAQDLTDTDVIQYNGQWREVLAVHRSLEEWEQLHGPLNGPDARTSPEAETARGALDWASPMWVLIELLSTARSTPAETDSDLIRLYRFDLVETQTLPAYETRPAAAQNGA